MSDYILINESMRSLNTKIRSHSESMAESFDGLSQAADRFVNCDGYDGKVARNIKTYIDNTYRITDELFIGLAQAMFMKYSAYAAKYQQEVDASYNAYVSTNTLEQITKELENKQTILNDTVMQGFLTVQKRLQADNDLQTSVRLTNLDAAATKLADAAKMTTKWKTTIERIEEDDINSEFTNIDALIAQISSLLDYQLGLNPTSPFSPAGYQKKVQQAGKAYTALVSEVSSLQEMAVAGQEGFQQMELDKVEAERKAREEKAAFWGFITDVVCTVATVAATATLGPVGAIVVGGVTGAIKSAVHEGLDQYAATGASWGELDWGRIAIKGAVGGLAGAATSAIGVGAGSLMKSAGNISSALGKFATKGMIGAGKGFLTSVVDQGANVLETTAIGLYEGKSLEEAWNDGKAVAKDFWENAGTAAFTGFTSQITGSITGGMDDGWKKNLVELGSNTVVGTANYGVTCLIKGEEMTWEGAAKAAGKAGAGTIINQASSWIKDDCLHMDKYGLNADSDFKAVAVTYVAGSVDKYLTGATGAFIDTWIDEGFDAAKEKKVFALWDENGKPTNAAMDLATGGAKDAAAVYYDRNLSEKAPPKVTRSDLTMMTDENGNIMKDEFGNPVMGYREQIVTHDGKGHQIIQDKVYYYEGSEGSQTLKVDTTVREKHNWNVLGNGKEIGEGHREEKVSNFNEMGYTEKTTKEELHYTTHDGKTVSTASDSRTTVYGDTVREQEHSSETVTDKHGRVTSSKTADMFGNEREKTTFESSSKTDYKRGTTDTTHTTTTQEGRYKDGSYDKTTTTSTRDTADSRLGNKGAYSHESTTVEKTVDRDKGTSTVKTDSYKTSGHEGKEFKYEENHTTKESGYAGSKTESSGYTSEGRQSRNGEMRVNERTSTESSKDTYRVDKKETVTENGKTYERNNGKSEEHGVERSSTTTEKMKDGEVTKTKYEKSNASTVTKGSKTTTTTKSSTSKGAEGKTKTHLKDKDVDIETKYKADHGDVSGRIGTNAGIAKYKQRDESKNYYKQAYEEQDQNIRNKYSKTFGMRTAEEIGIPNS